MDAEVRIEGIVDLLNDSDCAVIVLGSRRQASDQMPKGNLTLNESGLKMVVPDDYGTVAKYAVFASTMSPVSDVEELDSTLESIGNALIGPVAFPLSMTRCMIGTRSGIEEMYSEGVTRRRRFIGEFINFGNIQYSVPMGRNHALDFAITLYPSLQLAEDIMLGKISGGKRFGMPLKDLAKYGIAFEGAKAKHWSIPMTNINAIDDIAYAAMMTLYNI